MVTAFLSRYGAESPLPFRKRGQSLGRPRRYFLAAQEEAALRPRLLRPALRLEQRQDAAEPRALRLLLSHLDDRHQQRPSGAFRQGEQARGFPRFRGGVGVRGIPQRRGWQVPRDGSHRPDDPAYGRALRPAFLQFRGPRDEAGAVRHSAVERQAAQYGGDRLQGERDGEYALDERVGQFHGQDQGISVPDREALSPPEPHRLKSDRFCHFKGPFLHYIA